MRYLLTLSIFFIALISLVSFTVQAHGTQSHNHGTINNEFNYYEGDLVGHNYSGVSSSDLATIAAMTSAAAGHQFMRATESLQWSLAGSCIDSSSDDCGLSGALSQRMGEFLVTGILSAASDERAVTLSIGGTF